MMKSSDLSILPFFVSGKNSSSYLQDYEEESMLENAVAYIIILSFILCLSWSGIEAES